MQIRTLLWKLPLAVAGLVIGVVMLLMATVVCVLYVPPVRSFVMDKGITVARAQTGMDIDVGGLYLSPFHHSPMLFYHAYKGEADLPVAVRIDSLFVGHRGQDTLAYIHALRLDAKALTADLPQLIADGKLLSLPIVVERLQLDRTTFHSGSLIATVGVNVVVGHLSASSPALNIAQGQYPLHGLQLYDVFCGIDLMDAPPDTVPKDAAPLKLSFDVPDGDLRNIHFALTPVGLDLAVRSLQTSVLVDVGGNTYDARRIDIGGTRLAVGTFSLPIDTLYGDACVSLNNQLITSNGLHVRSDEIGAEAELSATAMNLGTMRVEVTGDADFRGSKAQLKGYYDIDDEAYAVQVGVERVNLSSFLPDSTRVVLAGEIEAEGQGIDPKRNMNSTIRMHLDDCIYSDFDFSGLDVHFRTDSATMLQAATKGLKADVSSTLPLFPLIDRIQPFVQALTDSSLIAPVTSLADLTPLDTLRRLIPPLRVQIDLAHGSPIQHLINGIGLDINKVGVLLRSDSAQTDLSVGASMPDINPVDSSSLRLPAATAALSVRMKEGTTFASLNADTRLTDGAMTMHGLRTDAGLWFDVERIGNDLNGTGCLMMDNLAFGEMDFGSRSVDLYLARSDAYPNALRADVQLDDIPLQIADSIIRMPDLDLRGAVRAQATVDGLPGQIDLSAEVLPLGVSARYKPFSVQLGLGETPIVMKHNKVDFNGLPIYGADSTYLALTGGLDLNSMRLDITLAADSFAPLKLVKDGPIPVHGDLATDIHGTVTGALDSIVADVAVTILPTTDITYPIDKKNLAQVKPHGTVTVRYEMAEDTLLLGGQINVDDGFIRYSPKAYPIMPFHVDSGSHVAFNGPVGQTRLNVSASQKVKADVQSEDEETRRVDFTTGVRVKGVVDSIGIRSIGFFLEAPEDETITNELASLDEDTREGLAASLLATGMYVGESNVAVQNTGYALSSIINSRINAAMANSKMGKVVDIDLSSAQTEHAGGKTNDLNIAISKSFFKDRLRVTVGSTFTDDPEVNQASGLLNNLSAEYKLTKEGNVLLRAFAQRDYNNILEGDLYKSGIGVRALKDWRKSSFLRTADGSLSGDSIVRTYTIMADADVAWRSNNSLGPSLTLTHAIKNLMGRGETFTVKGNGAYYWALRNRHPGDPKKTDTYKFGVNTSLVFPYLHWLGDSNPDGDTRYMLGYQYENIAGGYGVHKMSGSFTYFIEGSRYITHAFTPFSLSVVLMKAEADDLLDKAAEYPQLIKLIAGNEFVPSIGYNFIYNNYRSSRTVNTMLDLGVKESGNLINALYCAFGHGWNEKDKRLGSIIFCQFVKLTAELRNKFNITDRVSVATRLFAGANIPLGNSSDSPLSEAFYAGGPNSMRAASPYAYGPGNFYSDKYNHNFFHAGDVKLEANFELRFPIVWKLFGAAFVDAGNVWYWNNTRDKTDEATYAETVERMQLPDNMLDGLLNNPELLRQIALGTGAGLRLDLDGLVIRLDLGVAIHTPYQTYRYNKDYKADKSQPINSYFNIPSALDALRVNFGIGYPF